MQVSFTKGDVLAGFNKGKYRAVDTTTPLKEVGEVEFKIAGHTDVVLLENKLVTVGEALQKEQNPDRAKVSYHEQLGRAMMLRVLTRLARPLVLPSL